MKVSYAFEVRNDVKTLQSSSDLQFPLSEMLLKWQALRCLSGKNCMSVGQKCNTRSDTYGKRAAG